MTTAIEKGWSVTHCDTFIGGGATLPHQSSIPGQTGNLVPSAEYTRSD
jgi:hypothetical protein